MESQKIKNLLTTKMKFIQNIKLKNGTLLMIEITATILMEMIKESKFIQKF